MCLDERAADCIQIGACTEHSNVNALLALPSVLSSAHLTLWFFIWCPSSPIICGVSLSNSFCWNTREYNWQSPNVIYLKDFLTKRVISQCVFKRKRTLHVTEESEILSTIFLQSECKYLFQQFKSGISSVLDSRSGNSYLGKQEVPLTFLCFLSKHSPRKAGTGGLVWGAQAQDFSTCLISVLLTATEKPKPHLCFQCN